MSRILVAVSSPYAAKKVADPLADLARRLSAEVLVVHVSRPSGGQMREQEQADGEAAIRLLREHLQDQNVVVQDLLMFSDDIARAILNTAVEREVTLIVHTVALGGGDPLFGGRTDLELVSSRAFGSGAVALTYTARRA